MSEVKSWFLIGITLLVVLLGASWLVQGNEFFLYKTFAPKRAAVQRQVFENTRSFTQGMIQELENMQLEYVKADSVGKATIKPIILHRAAGFNLNDSAVSYELRIFITNLRTQSTLESR